METKTHWKLLTSPNYLGSYAFQPGEEKIVTIKEVKRETVTDPNGADEECTVAYFEEDVKPLILNKTNAGMIAKVWGTPYIEDWAGLRITLKVKKVKAFGEMVDAVRVAKDRPMDEAIICSGCGLPIQSASGKTPKEIATLTNGKCANCARKEKENG